MTKQTSQKRQLQYLVLGVLGMFAFAVFVMPPIYRVFCELTGLNGKPNTSAASASLAPQDLSRSVTMEFVTAVDAELPWTFVGERKVLEVHPGQINHLTFHVQNTSSERITARAIPSISPAAAASHLKKTECFCFRVQTLDAGASADMPVVFYIDPDLPKGIKTVTLSYRFYRQPDVAAKG
jgi:cytochrome c oxidase assembly protein subunit 11